MSSREGQKGSMDMKTYLVEMEFTGYMSVEVEDENEEEAREKGYQELDMCDAELGNIDAIHVDEVEEEE